MDSITPTEKAKLDEVAGLMLEIYQTLARMRYLDPAWIQPGPHDIKALIPMYRFHGLDDSIMYLYSVLPYINNAGIEGLDFFQGGSFADFRIADHVEQGRDPLYAGSKEDAMRPWVTPLSMLGNHKCVMIYSAKKHCIWVLDQESGHSYDHGLRKSLTDSPQNEDSEEEGSGWETEEGESEGNASESGGEEESDGEESNSEQGAKFSDEDAEDSDQERDESEQETDNREKGTEADDEDGSDNNEDTEDSEGIYDETDSRPAGEVLRDIVRWYHDLTETPGGGENSGPRWAKEATEPLYRKHGWPGDTFDGDAFLVGLTRAEAARSAEWAAEEPLRKVAELKLWLRDEDSSLARRQLQARLATAKTVDEEWLVRWELWQFDIRHEREARERLEVEKKAARLCPGGQAQRPEDLPLWELQQLTRENSWQQNNLERVLQDIKNTHLSEDDDDRAVQLRIQHVKQEASIYQKAYEASKKDAERLCPGKTFKLATGFDNVDRQSVTEQIQELEQGDESARKEVEDTRVWMAQLPDGAEQAKTSAEKSIQEMESLREWYATRIKALNETMEE
ncbi:hypothetical protein QQZ08_000516 [Neonectria magnoliae]|uniref:Uncharacterized protein n=1 Tax=Neonectria magnoliae TaxID=2732573 RepID=A0ABR1IHH7_9HYPO